MLDFRRNEEDVPKSPHRGSYNGESVRNIYPFLALVLGVVGVSAFLDSLPEKEDLECNLCQAKMDVLPIPPILNEGQMMEESLGSVRYKALR